MKYSIKIKGVTMTGKSEMFDLISAKQAGRKVAAVSCYDYTTARLVARAGAEMILVGDSAAQVMLGFDSTLGATMDFMVAITAAVRRAAPSVCLVADMPFLSYHCGISDAVKNAGRFVVEAGVQLIKIEAGPPQIDVVKAVSDAGMPVMAHIGIRPQSVAKLGKLRAEGTTADLAIELIALADKMVAAGANCVLLEGVAREVAAVITKRLPVPVIGCGAGPDCDGQILIISDILGLSEGAMPKFSARYAELNKEIVNALSMYVDDIHKGDFPDDDHSYHVKTAEYEKFERMLKSLYGHK